VSLALRESPDGVIVPVRVVPRAGRIGLDGVVDGALRVRLTAPPVEDAANRQLCAVLAELLDVPRRDVEIVSGARSRHKAVLVRGSDAHTVAARLGLG